MQQLTNYLKTINQNAHELSVQDSISILREIKIAMAQSLQNFADEKIDNDEKLMIQRHAQYVETFFEMVAHSFYSGKQDTQLHDGVMVSKSHLERIRNTINIEMKNAHEYLHRSLERISIAENESTYGIYDLLDDQ